VLAKYSRTVLQQQRVERLLDDRVGGDEGRAPGFGHRTLFFRQRVEQIRESGAVDVQCAPGVADEITRTARVL
jgi:hypothetical protein